MQCTNINGELPYAVGDDKWFADTIEKQSFTLSDYKLGRDGKAILIAAVPIISESKSTIGVVALGISLTWLNFISQNVELPPEGSITALGPEGDIMTHHGADRDNVAPPPSGQALKIMKARESGTLRAADISGSTRIYGFQKTKLGNIVVIVGLSQFVQYSEWSIALLHSLFSPLLVLILALTAAAWASETFVIRHVRSLIATADEIAAGNLQARSEVDYDEHELGELAAALDAMASSIEQSHSEIEQEAADKELVAREMQHRIVNSLAIALFIAYQTNQHSRSHAEFKKSFGERISALALSNRLLLEGNFKNGNVKETLETVFATHVDPDRQDFHLEGPHVELDSRATVSLSLTVHELATNAVKYGALSQPGGNVSVRWSVQREKDENWLSLKWQETGGLPVPAGTGQGFGSRLMHMMIVGRLGGTLDQTFAPTGLICKVAFPLPDPAEAVPGNDRSAQPAAS